VLVPKHELLVELNEVKAGLTKKAIFTIFVIIAFVFALTISVLDIFPKYSHSAS